MKTAKPKLASQKDLARLLKIDQKTVSRVFSASGSVSPETREKVMKAAEKLGYRPNNGARAMRTGRFNSIVLLQAMSRFQSNLHAQLLQGIQDGLGEKHLTLARLPDEELTRGETVPAVMRELFSDGVLVNYDTNIPEKMVELIGSQPLPVIWINSKQAFDCAHPDDEQGGRLAVEYLLKLGHRRIAYVDFHVNHSRFIHYSRVDRLNGYRKAMRAAKCAELDLSPQTQIPGAELASYMESEFRKLPQPPTALIGYSEGEVSAAMWGARALGLLVPKDLSVLTFGMHSPLIGVPLTIALNPMQAVGRAGAELVLKKIEKPSVKLAPARLEFTLLEGASCRAI
jgi:LacI family transcriptional regulator